MKSLNDLLNTGLTAHMQQVQKTMEDLSQKRFEVSDEQTGFLHVTITGQLEITDVTLGSWLADELTQEDAYELEQAIQRTVNQAIQQARAAADAELKAITKNMPTPDLWSIFRAS